MSVPGPEESGKWSSLKGRTVGSWNQASKNTIGECLKDTSLDPKLSTKWALSKDELGLIEGNGWDLWK